MIHFLFIQQWTDDFLRAKYSYPKFNTSIVQVEDPHGRELSAARLRHML